MIIDIGRVSWDPPANGLYGGFYLYVAKAISANPYNLLPYGNPADFSYDAGQVLDISLKKLYEENLINGKDAFFLALSTYVSQSHIRRISPLTPPVFISGKALLGRP